MIHCAHILFYNRISSVLFTLPVPAIAPHTQTAPTVAPQRNLLRQLTWGLPSRQAIPPR